MFLKIAFYENWTGFLLYYPNEPAYEKYSFKKNISRDEACTTLATKALTSIEPE
jgi:hypothetical protein